MTVMLKRPQIYLRAKRNGAVVFRLSENQRTNRIDIEQIASIKGKSREIILRDGFQLTPEDEAEIREWTAQSPDLGHKHDFQDVLGSIHQINFTAQWVQSTATDEELRQVMSSLLLAIYDLRTVLVRKASCLSS